LSGLRAHAARPEEIQTASAPTCASFSARPNNWKSCAKRTNVAATTVATIPASAKPTSSRLLIGVRPPARRERPWTGRPCG
jgi:hypothetical protein